MRLLLLVLLTACQTPQSTDSAATPAASGAKPNPSVKPGPPTDAPLTLLFSFTTGAPPDAIAGVRVWSNGKVETGAPGPDGATQWSLDRTLTPDRLRSFSAAIASTDVARVPVTLPADSTAPADAPSATWQIGTATGLRTFAMPRYGGIQPKVFHALTSMLTVSAEEVRSVWTARGERVTLTCNTRTSSVLGPIQRRLLDSKLPLAPEGPDAPPLLSVQWSEDGTSWGATLHDDGVVTRELAGGSRARRALPEADLAQLRDAIASIVWDDERALCAARAKRGAPAPSEAPP